MLSRYSSCSVLWRDPANGVKSLLDFTFKPQADVNLQRRASRSYNFYSGLWRNDMPMVSIVVRCYNTNLQQPPQFLIKPKKVY
jgi:hypothetical protein